MGDGMNVTYSKTVLQAFIAGAPELEKLVNLLQDRIGKVKISADCADGFSREFGTVDDLINYENPKSKEIIEVSLSTGLRHVDSEFAEVALPSTEGISIRFGASEDVVAKLRDDIIDILEGMRPWYNMLSLINSYPAAVVTFFIVCIGALLVDLWLYEYSSKVGVAGVIIGLIGFISAILFLVHKLFNYLFPWQVFMIGQGKSRFRDKERIQWGVGITFLVSLAAGLVIWLITR
jgi:hypothetical protein